MDHRTAARRGRRTNRQHYGLKEVAGDEKRAAIAGRAPPGAAGTRSAGGTSVAPVLAAHLLSDSGRAPISQAGQPLLNATPQCRSSGAIHRQRSTPEVRLRCQTLVSERVRPSTVRPRSSARCAGHARRSPPSAQPMSERFSAAYSGIANTSDIMAPRRRSARSRAT
jgi:hypothetical protein